MLGGNGSSCRFRLTNQGGAEIALPLARPPAVGASVVIGIRPEHFVPSGTGDVDLPLTLDVAEHLGATSYLYANTRAGEPVVVEAETSDAAQAGSRITVGVPAAKAMVFDSDGLRLR
jgi:lactose/L-arabinose transport system ATP-binding protein